MSDLFSTIQSFEKAFEEYYPGLVAFAYKQINSLEASEDIVQELFVYLYENKERIEIKESFKGYLFSAVFNRCKSFQRKQLTREKYEAELKIKDQNEYRDLLTETEFEERVYREINKLPERCREIFTLNRFEDLTNDEIAKRLNISKRTVETQISKALKILRSSLDPKTFFVFFI
ncbi:MAG: RNA polymerase sigma-70 factor [Cyclobacteriaceae bacterium]